MRSSRSIYVGNLPLDIKESEIEDLFNKYGRIVDIELKIPPRPPGYCFVEFEDSRDAEDAIRGRDGYNFDGCHLRVELAHGGRGQSSSFDRHGGYGGGGSAAAASRRSEYRVVVRGLPASASWQDLKDHMRKAGDVCFAQVFRKGDGTMGLVDYTNYDDMKYAICKLDDTEFKNPFSKAYIRIILRLDGFFAAKCVQFSRRNITSFRQVKAYEKSPSRGRSPIRSRCRSRSPSRSRSRSPSRSRSRSPSRSRSRSRSLGRKRSNSSEQEGCVSRSASRSRSVTPVKSKPRSKSRSNSRSASPDKVRAVSP